MTPDMMRVVHEQRLSFVATVGTEGVPNHPAKQGERSMVSYQLE